MVARQRKVDRPRVPGKQVPPERMVKKMMPRAECVAVAMLKVDLRPRWRRSSATTAVTLDRNHRDRVLHVTGTGPRGADANNVPGMGPETGTGWWGAPSFIAPLPKLRFRSSFLEVPN